MKCPKCKTGIIVPEKDFDGREISRVCMLCGERTYSDFTIRQPVKADNPMEGARLENTRRPLTVKEKALIAAGYADGLSHRKIAEQIKRSESSVTNHINRTIKKEASHV